LRRALVLSGGIFHDFPATSGVLGQLLCDHQVEPEITEDLEAGLARLDAFDLLVVNALRWRMYGDKYDPYRDQYAYSPSERARERVREHLRRGRGLLAVHTAVICFDDWPEWGDLLGAQWKWGQSGHPPLATVRVNVRAQPHPLTAGIGDFDIEDEVYGFLDQRPGLEPLMTSEHGGAVHPLLWVRESLGARVAVDLLGHGLESLSVAEHRTALERAVGWVLE
jgi:type 1 glutamine amidotransferase